MKKMLTRRRTLAVPVLLASSAWAFGQSLGQASGELWIGRPLDITIPARFASSDSRDTCVHAEVAYGDTRLAPSRVRTTVMGEDEQRRVRITTDQVVDEPLVTVTLRAGCGSTMTRTYTLLPDMPSEAVIARLLQDPAAQAQAQAQAVAVAPPARPVATMLPTRAEGRPAGLRLMPAIARVPAFRLRTASTANVPAKPVAQPRLRLDAIEADASSLLRVSATLSQPGDAAMRAKAALLWQAISAEPQDLMRSTAALQKLETELAQLRQTANGTRAEMASLRHRLDEAQPWYLSPRMVQGLALLVLATAGAVALLAWRTRRAGEAIPWYTPSDRAPLEPQGIEPVAVPAEAPVPAARSERTGPVSAPAPLVDEPAVLAQRSDTAPADLPPLDLVLDPEPPKPAMPRPASSGLLRVETLAATLEEVEFLVSLGLHSDAMDVLKAYIEDSASPAPVAFFELMRVCHLAEDPQAVEAVRRRYAKLQGTAAPLLEQVLAAGGLAQQRALADRITRAWGTPEALPLIEQALFDPPAANAPLTGEAARDLVCLHDVAMLLATDIDQAPHDAADHPLAPWAHAEHVDEAQAYAQAIADDLGGHRFALDIDLSVVPQALPEQPREPDLLELAALAAAEQQAARAAAERAASEAEDAFSAAVAFERAPTSRY